MKIRIGFVSNSSSSSFSIYGTQFDYSQMEEMLKSMNKFPKKNPYNKDIGAWLEYEGLEIFLGLTVFHCCDSERIWIGRSWETIDGEETGNQFKKSVEDKLEEALGRKIECENISGEIYN